MNARILLHAISSDANGLPPYEPDTAHFQVTVEGVRLDMPIHHGDDLDLSVVTILHLG